MTVYKHGASSALRLIRGLRSAVLHRDAVRHVAALLANRSLRVAMGRAAAAHASTFSWEASGDLVLAQYDGMASRVGRGV